MGTEVAQSVGAPMSVGRALLFGTLTVGTLDLLDAFVFFGLRGVAPVRILQSIASGWLGKAAFQGGAGVALLGLGSHYFIAFGIVATFLLASRQWPALTERPALYGPLYGVVVYLIMNFVVIPLSAASSGRLTPPVVANGVLIHIVGVGLPSALFARAAAGGR
jgi:hypothetical protein